MPVISEHHARQPYPAAVAAALSAAGIGVHDWGANASDPRDGALVIDRNRTHADAEVVLCWHEERGRCRGISREEDHGELRHLHAADLGVLPGPADVTAWAREVVAGTDPASEPGACRDFEDDDEVAQRLRAGLCRSWLVESPA
uniref:DUF6292 family protein n=1 Tax=Amycolatopsis sp. CA-096443 TaxID=3239919 RepID=UPI003F494A6C